jgi:hypothetical protein
LQEIPDKMDQEIRTARRMIGRTMTGGSTKRG